MTFICKAKKIAIYVNSEKKTCAQIQKETGCTAIINGGLFTMSTFTPVAQLKVNKKLLAAHQKTYWGFGWNNSSLFPTLTTNYGPWDNFIACVCLVKDGAAVELDYSSDLGGARPRTAFGAFSDGRVWLYITKTNTTPEQLQKAAIEAGVKSAIMLDGGGSTQGIFPTEKITSSRKVHNFICVWANEEAPQGGDTMFKIALDAGHGINTSGKRCLKSLDPNETREWWLNNRICDYVESYLKGYSGYEVLRVDDSDDGKTDVPLETRVSKANSWDADFYLSIHHNAGINGGSGGGIIAYTYPNTSKATIEWRNALYDALIKYTGLKGNRSVPKASSNLYVLRKTKMSAVLLECGFMDSKTDVPQILSDEYAQNCAKAIVEVIAKRGGLKELPSTIYRVQVGAFTKKAEAEKLQVELTRKGYSCFIVQN